MSFLFGGDKSTSQTTIPAWVQKPAQQNLANASAVAGLGYTPYYGPDVAAFTPMQNAAFEGTNQMASAFGMPTAQGNGMPAPQTFAGGVQGYSSAPMYEEAIAALKAKNPTQYAALMQILQKFTQQSQPAPVAAPTRATSSLMRGSSSDLSAAERAARSVTGGSSYSSLNTPLSYAPGGVNTRNPGSLLNTTAANLTSRTQSAPTSASRPMARP